MSKKVDFFIVGAAKAGTTSLYHFLAQHPEVYMSPIKEPNYFADDIDLTALRPEVQSRMKLLNIPDWLRGNMGRCGAFEQVPHGSPCCTSAGALFSSSNTADFMT